MDQTSPDEITRLEAAVAEDPTSEELRERILEALSANSERHNDPRRFELIGWFLKHHPRHFVCSTPFAHVDPVAAPGPYRDLKALWLALVNESPADPELSRG